MESIRKFMKYIKVFVGILLAIWVGTLTMGNRIRPGNVLYPVRVYINDPLWVWVHITAPGRAATLRGLLDIRYADLEHAWFAQDAKQTSAAEQALQNTNEAVLAAIEDYASSGNYKVADSLATISESIAKAHEQVFNSLVTHGAVMQTSANLAFVKGAVQALDSARIAERQKFAKSFSKEDLVRGIDDALRDTRNLQERVQAEFTEAASVLQPDQKQALKDILMETQAGYDSAKTKLDTDQYVDSFMLANTMQGRLQEVHIAIRATQDFGVPVTPSAALAR